MYGISKLDLEKIQKKHNLQRQYLKDNSFVTSQGQLKTLQDISFSANHSERYYSELINKINTINNIIETDFETIYKPIFITVTLDGFYRGFLYGHFDKYNELKHKKQIPNNERFGYLKDKIKNKEKFTIKDLYNVLNFQFDKFNKSQIFKDIKANEHKIHYIRVCEPHKKDGVPHLHIMMYVPVQYVDRLKQFYIKYFPAPQNLKSLNKNQDDGQLKGFQFEINSAPAYILKYIFKSFLDVKNKNDLDYLQAWYIKNRILRVVTSHSIIPAWVYRKIAPLDNDWFYLTEIKKFSSCEWSKEDDYIYFEDENNRSLEYNRGEYKIYYKDRIIREFGIKKELSKQKKDILEFNKQIKLRKKDLKENGTLQDRQKIHLPKLNQVPIFIDNKKHYMFNNQVVRQERLMTVSKLNDNQLLSYYYHLDSKFMELDNYSHFTLVKNEMIKRNFLNSPLLNVNDVLGEYGF